MQLSHGKESEADQKISKLSGHSVKEGELPDAETIQPDLKIAQAEYEEGYLGICRGKPRTYDAGKLIIIAAMLLMRF